MPLAEFSAVRLNTDRYLASEGVGRGAIGFILDAYDDGYDVEFSHPDGTTIAWFFLQRAEVEPVPEIIASADTWSTV